MPNLERLPFASRVIGTGSAFPKNRVTNHDITQKVETSDEWIVERTGIRERRASTPETLTKQTPPLHFKPLLRP